MKRATSERALKGEGVRSLGRRLSGWLALQGFVAAFAVSATVYGFNYWLIQARQRDELTLKADVVRHVMAETGPGADGADLRHRLKDFLAGHRDMGLIVTTAPGQVLFDSRDSGRLAEQARTLTTAWQDVWPEAPPAPIRVELFLDVSRDAVLLRKLGLTLLAGSMAGALVVSATGLLLVRRGLHPVQALAEQIDAVALDKVGFRLDGAGQPRELLPLVDRFNRLLARVERAYAQLEGFNADVAHEMRTPLTTLIGSSELALRADRSNEELKDVIVANLEDLRRLSIIINDMLFLSQADRGATARSSFVASVAGSLGEIVEYHEAALLERNLKVACLGDARAHMDIALVRRAVSNLVSNATRYATPGTLIRIRIGSDGPGTSIMVENLGCDIKSEHLPRLFDRFYRVERARQAGIAHHGLGLAIVAAIARMHGGEPFATSTDGVTAIGIVLPLKPLAHSHLVEHPPEVVSTAVQALQSS